MAKGEKGKDFKTFYKAGFSSGGVLQNEIIPAHINLIISLLDMVSLTPTIADMELLRNKINTQFLVHKQGFKKPQEIEDQIKEVDLLIKDWRDNHPGAYPTTLIEKIQKLAGDFFFSWNESGAGLVFIAQDASRDKKIYDTIVGNQ